MINFFAPALIIQILLVIHVLRTGRPIYWVFIIFFLPYLGSLAYFLVELLPELSQSYTARRAVRGIRRTIDPGASLRHKQLAHQASGSVDTTRHLAGELTRNGEFDAAIELYESALTGLYEHDPDLLLGLADAQFGKEDFSAAHLTLEKLAKENPHYKSAEGDLLRARCLEELGELVAAEDEYSRVVAYFAGAEAGLRYGRLLEKVGKSALAGEQYNELLLSADIAPRHYKRAQKQWLDEARKRVRSIQKEQPDAS